MSFDKSNALSFFKFDIEIYEKNVFIKTSSEVVILWFERFFDHVACILFLGQSL